MGQEIEQTAKLKNQNLYFSFPQALKSITDNSSTKQAQLNSILEEKTQEIIDLQMKLQNKSISPISGSSPENSSKNEIMNESESNSDWILLDNEKKRQVSEQSNKSKSSGTGNSSENLNENLNNTASLMNDALEEGEMVDGEDSGSSGSGSSSSQSLSESDESGTSEVTSSIDEIGTSV